MKLNKFTIQKSFAISAGAGSGKTYTLSRRYINALLGFDYFREDYKTQEGYYEDLKSAKVNQIVTITYTEAAALEMKGRIFELVHKIINFNYLDKKDGDYSSIQEANANLQIAEQAKHLEAILQQAYTQSSNAKISTIHSFCLDIIKANSDIARIDTKLSIINDDEKASELSQIIFEVLNHADNNKMVLDISKDISMFFINNLINKYVSSSKFRKDYDGFDKNSIAMEEYKKLIFELYPLPKLSDADDELDGDEIRSKWAEAFYQNFLDFNAKTWSDVGEDKAPSLGVKKYPILSEIKSIMEKQIPFYAPIDSHKEEQFFRKIEMIKTLLQQIKTKYDNKLKELDKIDFDTIITKTLEIMPKVKTNFRFIMVDEFQDTNETQFEIVKNALNPMTNLFVVGDSKQSIYSFQGAEIEVFNNAVEDKTYFSSIENMSKNFRSDGIVLDTVNKIFDELLKKDEHLKLISQNYEAQPQELEVAKNEKVTLGSFKYLITPQGYGEEVSELDTIVQLISDIAYEKLDEYKHISKLIKAKEKAIAIVFDSSTKMLELKQKLREKGITAKVSASDNFYFTKEINDIFNTLKAIDILSAKPKELSATCKYYLVGAMRSNILRIDDNSIKRYLDTNTLPENLIHYIEVYKELPLAQFVKYIYEHSNLYGTYVHFDDVEQRIANMYKFLNLCREYQESNESSLYTFLKLLENSIYFSEAKEDEAFFKSPNTKSVEICSIHSTKGLAYPLVLLGNSEKGLYSQITSDSLKHNNFTFNGKKKEIVGFKISDYQPLSLRVLKQIDKLKHLAEKKRLLYVALTRAEHDIIISAQLNQKKDGDISLKEDSYLSMICTTLGISKEELFEKSHKDSLHIKNDEAINHHCLQVNYQDFSLQSIVFESKERISATSNSETYDEASTRLGTVTHKIFELYWDRLDGIVMEDIFGKFDINEDTHKTQIINAIEAFLNSDVHVKLKSGVEHKFELEFNTPDKRGFIDLVYFDEDKNGWVIVDFKTGKKTEDKELQYQEQLNFYENVLVQSGLSVVGNRLLWV